MSKAKIFFLFFINILLDMSVLPRFSFWGISPSVTIAILIVLAMNAKSEKITYYGIFMGFLFDMVFGFALGVRALSFYLITYYAYRNRKFEGATFSYGLLATSIAVVFNEIYLFLLNAIKIGSINTVNFIDYFIRYLPLELIFNLMIYSILYLIIYQIISSENKKYFY